MFCIDDRDCVMFIVRLLGLKLVKGRFPLESF